MIRTINYGNNQNFWFVTTAYKCLTLLSPPSFFREAIGNMPHLCSIVLFLLVVGSSSLVDALSTYSSCPPFLAPRSHPCPAAASATPSPYGAGYLPIIGTGICGKPPVGISTDGCDEVCTLAKMCCNGWQANTSGSVKLLSGSTAACSQVDCGNVCRMACDRQGIAESCSSVCTSNMAYGDAYVFVRPGVCDIPNQLPDPACPTHVGFGFEVSPRIFVFGSLENGPHSAAILFQSVVVDGADNGFWMTTGSEAAMLATFADPAASCFHGTLGVSTYVEYKTYAVPQPNVCNAVKTAEDHYGSGYGVIGNNCLNAVYNILQAYGVQFAGAAAGPSFDWCPGQWYNDLTFPDWSNPIVLPTTGTPATAVFCSSTAIPTKCGTGPPTSASQSTGATGNCPTTIGALGPTTIGAFGQIPAACGPLPGVNNLADCSLQGLISSWYLSLSPFFPYPDGVPCAIVIPDLCSGNTVPDAAYWCSQCKSGNENSMPASCFNIYFDIGNVRACESYFC